MAQPLPYERDYDFQNFQSGHPSTPLPGDKVNAELDQVAATLDEVLARIALLQDDDTALKRKSVGRDQLADNVDLGFDPPTTWTTATAYTAGNTVFSGTAFYQCLVSHTSGTFSTDLAAAKWSLLADFTTAVADAEAAQAAAEAAQAAAEAAQAEAASSASAASTSAGTATTKAAEAAASAATATSKAAEAAGSAGDASASSGTAQAAAVTATTKAGEASDSAAAAAASAASIVVGAPGGVQAYSANLSAVAALAPTDGNFIVGDGSTWTVESGATARASLGLGSAAVADLLDEEDMASNSATAVPSQQSVNVGKLQKVATRTAMKALSTSVHSVVYLSESGRAGVFVFNSSNLSLLVTNDPGEILYVAPGSDATGASGAWVRQRDNLDIFVDWAGTVHDGTTNDYTAIQRAINLMEYLDGVGILRFGGYSYKINTGLRIKKGLRVQGVGSGRVGTAISTTVGVTQIIAGGAIVPFTIRADATATNVYFVHLKDMTIDCANVGTYCIIAQSLMYPVFENLALRRATVGGFLSNDGNDAISQRGIIRNCVYEAFANAAAASSFGFALANTLGMAVANGTVQWIVENCSSSTVDGNGLIFAGGDNNYAKGLWQGYIQPGGTGYSVSFEVGHDALVARNNRVQYLAGGSVFAEAGTYGNVILDGSSEGSAWTIESGAYLHYSLIDYSHADRFSTRVYKMSDSVSVGAGLFIPNGTNCTHALVNSLYNGLAFSDAGNGDASAMIPIPAEWADGDITGVTIYYTCGSANTSKTARFRIRLEPVVSGLGIGTPNTDEYVTVTINDSANVAGVATLTFGTPLSITRGWRVYLRLTREPADAADTATGTVYVPEVVVHYESDGPDSAGQTFTVPQPYKT